MSLDKAPHQIIASFELPIGFSVFLGSQGYILQFSTNWDRFWCAYTDKYSSKMLMQDKGYQIYL